MRNSNTTMNGAVLFKQTVCTYWNTHWIPFNVLTRYENAFTYYQLNGIGY